MMMRRNPFYLLVFLLATLAFGVWSCDPDEDFLIGGDVNLEFSRDTLRFDTVFTELGSATRSFRVYNRADQPVRIDKIRIAGTTGIDFRMNVDGIPGDEIDEVEIFANDSIWIFVEVTIDPDQPISVSPFVIEDQVIFETGSRESQVYLEAWGQNANYFPSRFNAGVAVEFSCENGTFVWDSELPYVIYGEIIITDCLLEVAAGTEIYVHGGIARNDVFGTFNDGFLFTLETGSIHFNGTAEDPIIIQGDRLESVFDNVNGQWLGLFIGPGSTNNRVEHTLIKNSIIGFSVDSTASLSLSNTIIANTAGPALRLNRASVSAENCLFYDNAVGALQVIQGGSYAFEHCTFANFGFDASAVTLTNFECFTPTCNIAVINPIQARFDNCIIFGSRRDEIQLIDADERQNPGSGIFDVSFNNCVVRVDELLENNDGRYADFFETLCQGCVNGDREDLLFIDRNMDDYHLDSLSIAIDVGLPISGLEIDLDGVSRDANPDAGCFERVE